MQRAQAGPQLLRDWIERAAQRYPDKACIASAEDGRILSYRQLQQLTAHIGASLRERGVAAKDRVALLAGNSIEHLACYFGVMAAGATACTAHVEMNRNQLGGILDRLKPKLILYQDGLPLDEALASAGAMNCHAETPAARATTSSSRRDNAR